MASGVVTYSKTAASNATADSTQNWAEGMAPSAVNDSARAGMASVAKWRDDLNGSITTGGTATAYTVTSNQTFAALTAGYQISFAPHTDCGSTVTLNVDGLGAKPLRTAPAVELNAGHLKTGTPYRATYFSSNSGEWILEGWSPPITADLPSNIITTAKITDANVTTAKLADGAVTPVKVDAAVYAFNGGMVNGTITASVAASALTIALKTSAGTDPSATDVVKIPFRNVTASTGDYAVRSVTGALSLVISSGSTMGFSNSTPGRLWIVAFDNGGTVALGAINCLSGTNIYPLQGWGIASTSAEGGAGGADSAHVIYTSSALTSKAYIPIAYLTWEAGGTLATAGTWNAAPTRIQLYGPGVALPGSIVQGVISTTGAVATGTTEIPSDDTIPQSTEGTQFMTQAITAASSANVLAVSWLGVFAHNTANSNVIGALFKGAASDALSATAQIFPTANSYVVMPGGVTRSQAASLSSITYAVRAGSATGTGGTLTFNGTGGSRKFGGVSNSYLSIEEIMA